MKLIMALLVLLALPSTAPSAAAETNSPPRGMTQQQFDTLVDAISRAVVTRLKEQGVAVSDKPESVTNDVRAAPPEDFENRVAMFMARARQVLTLIRPSLGNSPVFQRLWTCRGPGGVDCGASYSCC